MSFIPFLIADERCRKWFLWASCYISAYLCSLHSGDSGPCSTDSPDARLQMHDWLWRTLRHQIQMTTIWGDLDCLSIIWITNFDSRSDYPCSLSKSAWPLDSDKCLKYLCLNDWWTTAECTSAWCLHWQRQTSGGSMQPCRTQNADTADFHRHRLRSTGSLFGQVHQAYAFKTLYSCSARSFLS